MKEVVGRCGGRWSGAWEGYGWEEEFEEVRRRCEGVEEEQVCRW